MEELRRERARVPPEDGLGEAEGPRPCAISSKPALSPAIRRVLLRLRTA